MAEHVTRMWLNGNHIVDLTGPSNLFCQIKHDLYMNRVRCFDSLDEYGLRYLRKMYYGTYQFVLCELCNECVSLLFWSMCLRCKERPCAITSCLCDIRSFWFFRKLIFLSISLVSLSLLVSLSYLSLDDVSFKLD